MNLFRSGALALLSAAALAQAPVTSCTFEDLDGGSILSQVVVHGCNGGYFHVTVPTPAGSHGPLRCVYAFYSNGLLVDIPQSIDFMAVSCSVSAAPPGTSLVRVPYSLDIGSDSSALRPYSYSLPGAGAYELRLWLGNEDQLDYSIGAAPQSGVLAWHATTFQVVQPEVMVTIPSRNSLNAGAGFKFQVRLSQAVSYDRYFLVGGSGGLVPSQSLAVIYANTTVVQLDAHCYFPSGRLHVIAVDSDGSAVGGDDDTSPVQELYVSQHVECVAISTEVWGVDAPPSPSEPHDGRSGPYYGEMLPRTPTGDHGAGTECKQSGGADPNPTGMPNFRLCGPCKQTSLVNGNDRKVCQSKIPGNNYPLVTEPICGPAEKFVQTNPFSQSGPGGHYETDFAKRCIVTETTEPVSVYKLDGSGTVECFFIGVSLGWFFFGTELSAKYCCYYSLVDDDAQQVPVRRCTTVTQ